MSEPEEIDRAVKAYESRAGKNGKSHQEKPQYKKHTKKQHKKPKKQSNDDDSSSSSSSSSGSKEHKKSKKKHKRPHSLLTKHKPDPSDLLEGKSLTIEEEAKSVGSEPVQVALDPILVAPIPVAHLIPTAEEHIPQFYSQLQFLDAFFKAKGITYWLNGGSLLGQVRNATLLPWADCNSIGVEDIDGKKWANELRSAAKKYGYDVWNSVHGLKLRTSSSPVATDIYFYLRSGSIFLLASERSRKQWPKDYFCEEESVNLVQKSFGGLTLSIPRNANRYLATLYGEDFLNTARYCSFDHFTGMPRPLPLLTVKLS